MTIVGLAGSFIAGGGVGGAAMIEIGRGDLEGEVLVDCGRERFLKNGDSSPWVEEGDASEAVMDGILAGEPEAESRL